VRAVDELAEGDEVRAGAAGGVFGAGPPSVGGEVVDGGPVAGCVVDDGADDQDDGAIGVGRGVVVAGPGPWGRDEVGGLLDLLIGC
jgi:hypothetical protein